jgi:hypothetical protein
MKILIIEDGLYDRLLSVLGATPGGAEIIGELRRRPLKLPAPRTLHQMAKNGETPEAFADTRARMDAAQAALDTTRERMHKLLVEAGDVRVKTGALSRWSGYSDRRVYAITKGNEGNTDADPD